MVIELTSIAGGGTVVTAAGVLRQAAHRRRTRQAPAPPAGHNPSWRLLEDDAEVREAIERAIACEQASMALAARRADRLAALRRQLAPASVASATPTPTPLPQRVEVPLVS